MKTKILRIIASMDPRNGGPCQGIRNSIPEQEKVGVSNEVVCLDAPDAEFIGKDAFVIHALGPAKGPWKYSSCLFPWLEDHLHKYDVVIVHGLWLYHGFAVRKAIKNMKKRQSKAIPRWFVMPHGMLDPYFQKDSGRRLKALRNIVYWKLIEQNVVNEADGVLFTCEEELSLAREPFRPYKPKKELNIGYGISTPPSCTVAMAESFYSKYPTLRGKSYVLFLSRIHEKKGVDLLIKAYTSFKRNTSDSSYLPKLLIAGPGLDSDYGKEMQSLAEEMDPDIYFPGMLLGDEKWGAFYGCEAFILPSHQENFGIAVVEAMACRKPVLISDQVNIWREIKDGGAGLIAPDTLEGVEFLLKAWFEIKEGDKKEMGSNAQKVYEQHFSIGPAARRMIEAVQGNFEC